MNFPTDEIREPRRSIGRRLHSSQDEHLVAAAESPRLARIRGRSRFASRSSLSTRREFGEYRGRLSLDGSALLSVAARCIASRRESLRSIAAAQPHNTHEQKPGAPAVVLTLLVLCDHLVDPVHRDRVPENAQVSVAEGRHRRRLAQCHASVRLRAADSHALVGSSASAV
jgi:hypothetical protein